MVQIVTSVTIAFSERQRIVFYFASFAYIVYIGFVVKKIR